MKHYVYAVVDSEPKLYEFSSIKKVRQFVSKFKVDSFNGYWIDMVFSGKLHDADRALTIVKEKK